MGKPVYKFCRVDGYRARICTQREDHMEKEHGLKGKELEQMILVPRYWFSREKPEKLMTVAEIRAILAVKELRAKYFPPMSRG